MLYFQQAVKLAPSRTRFLPRLRSRGVGTTGRRHEQIQVALLLLNRDKSENLQSITTQMWRVRLSNGMLPSHAAVKTNGSSSGRSRNLKEELSTKLFANKYAQPHTTRTFPRPDESWFRRIFLVLYLGHQSDRLTSKRGIRENSR